MTSTLESTSSDTASPVAAGRVDPLAAKAFIPYLGWIGFATALNTAIVAKNQ